MNDVEPDAAGWEFLVQEVEERHEWDVLVPLSHVQDVSRRFHIAPGSSAVLVGTILQAMNDEENPDDIMNDVDYLGLNTSDTTGTEEILRHVAALENLRF